jgi:hypothetical protein
LLCVEGLEDKERNAAGRTERASFRFQQAGAAENYRGALMLGQPSELLNKFVAIHRGHDDVGDYKVGKFQLCDSQAFAAIAGFNHRMAMVGEQGGVEPAARGIIIYDQNLWHSAHTRCSEFWSNRQFKEGGENKAALQAFPST